MVAWQSTPNKMYDIKRFWGKETDGHILNGKYATLRDFGNALAGLNARIGDTAFEAFQRMAGAVHVGEGIPGIIQAYFGREYGPKPTYGELLLQYRMSKIGYYDLYKDYQAWK